MTTPTAVSLTVEPIGGPGVPVYLVAGLPGHQEVAFMVIDGAVRTLNPARGLSVHQLERPIDRGLPSIAALVRGAVMQEEQSC
ncbi:MAG TPA: hypothetical protein VD995_02805 [Azospirillum sp.]|nr:hypothetical protein [Azospirillum sp.]